LLSGGKLNYSLLAWPISYCRESEISVDASARANGYLLQVSSHGSRAAARIQGARLHMHAPASPSLKSKASATVYSKDNQSDRIYCIRIEASEYEWQPDEQQKLRRQLARPILYIYISISVSP
jgi:hypothetical protein